VQTSVEAVNIADLVHEIQVMLAPPVGFVVDYESGVQVLRTERITLQMVLENLIGNALKHHDRATGRVVVSMRMVDGLAEFRVTDDGPGIPPQFHARIFQMFQTLQSRDTLEASGLGLAIVKRHVETHEGKIWVESDPAQRGSCFAFTWKPAPA
jgi:signal transduction histidine kinase